MFSYAKAEKNYSSSKCVLRDASENVFILASGLYLNKTTNGWSNRDCLVYVKF